MEFTITRYFFHHENDFNGFLDPKNLGKDTKFITPGQIQMELYWVYIGRHLELHLSAPHLECLPKFFSISYVSPTRIKSKN